MILLIILLSLQINEVMYDPVGSDNNFEYIELFGGEGVPDLTNFIIGDEVSNDSLRSLNNISGGNFALIVEEGFDIKDFLIPLYSAGPTIGNALNNDADSIFLYNGTNLLLDFFYTSSIGGNGNNLSLSWNGSEWRESIPTPGRENEFSSGNDIALTIELESPLFTFGEYTSLFKLTNNGPGVFTNITVNYTFEGREKTFVKEDVNRFSIADTGNIAPVNEGNFTLCGSIVSSSPIDNDINNNHECRELQVLDSRSIPCNINLSVQFEKIIIDENESFQFSFVLTNETFPFVIEYFIEDLFGKVAKQITSTKNTHPKTFSPTKGGGYILDSGLSFVACNNTAEQGPTQTLIAARPVPKKTDSFFVITQVNDGTDNRVKFGESFTITLDVSKGNSTKSAIEAYVEDNGKKKVTTQSTRIRLEDTFQDYHVTLPLQLKTNCHSDFEEGRYTIVVEGLDTKAIAPVNIKDSLPCETIAEEKILKIKETKKKSFTSEISFLPASALPGESITLSALLTNELDQSLEVEVKSLLYRGNKRYFESAPERYTIPKDSFMTVFENITVGKTVPSGEYKVKLFIQRDDRKTAQEIIRDIVILKEEKITQELSSQPTTRFEQQTILYQAPSVLETRFVPILLLISILSLTIHLLWKN